MDRRRLLHVLAPDSLARGGGTKPQPPGSTVAVRIKGHQRGCSPPHSTQLYYPHCHRRSNVHRVGSRGFLPRARQKPRACKATGQLSDGLRQVLLDGAPLRNHLYIEASAAKATAYSVVGEAVFELRRERRYLSPTSWDDGAGDQAARQQPPWRKPPAPWILLELERRGNIRRRVIPKLSPRKPPLGWTGPSIVAIVPPA